jgi:hypothetical protein
VLARAVGVVADERVDARADELPPGLDGLVQTARHPASDRVRGAAAKGVVELRAHQRAPGVPEQRPAVAPAGGERQRGQRLRCALEQQFGFGVVALKRGPGGLHALQGPGISVAPAQLAAQRRHPVGLGLRRTEVLVEPRDPHVGIGLEGGEQVPHPADRGRRGMVIGADRHRQVRGRGTPHQHRLEAGPCLAKTRGVVHQPGAGFVSIRRQVVQQNRAAIGRVPPEQVTFLARLPAEPAPQHAVAHAELRRERGPRGRMAERVGGIHYRRAPAQRLGVGSTEQQVADQGLAGRNDLVGQNVPGPDLQPAGAHQGAESRALVGAYAEVVLQQHGLAVEIEAAELRRCVEAVEQVVEGGNQASHEGGSRQVPLSVPVGVRDEVDRQPGHRSP